MSIDAIPCCDALGAEVIGVDLSQSLDDTAVDTLKLIWAEYRVMVFGDQTLPDPHLIRFSRQFNECDRATIGDTVLNGDIPPEIAIVFNVKENG